MYKNLLKTALVVLAIATSISAQAIDRQKLTNYAAQLKGLKKEALKAKIHEIIGSPKTLKYGGKGKGTWWGFYRTDRIAETNECRNRYSDKKFYFTGNYETSGASIDGMNIEHSFPKSWWGKEENDAYKDLHHLYPSDSKVNSAKGNLPMGKVKGSDGSTEKIGNSEGTPSSFRVFEPANIYKGDFSRTYMYMCTAYQNLTWKGDNGLRELENNKWPTLQEWAYKLYLQWVRTDLVDQIEVERNNAVAEIQGNRNLFIDYPYLAEYVWGDSVDVAFDPYTSITTAADDSRYGNQVAPKVATPTFSEPEGTFLAPFNLTLSCATEGATIYYTTDGSTPSAASTKYESPVTISQTTTVKAIAINGADQSAVASATYTFASSAGSYYFVKLNGQPTTGKKYLIVANNGGTLKAAKRATPKEGTDYSYLYVQDVNETQGVIIRSDYELAYTFEASGSGFTIKDNADNYYSHQSNFKTFTITTDASNADVWNVSMNADGTFKITASNDGHLILYSPQYKSFGQYANADAANLYPVLYEETTYEVAGIEDIQTETAAGDGKIYNLQGIQMPSKNSLQPGIYILNGKKFIVK